MQKNSTFQKKKINIQKGKLAELCGRLPYPAVDFLNEKSDQVSLSTLISYAYDLITFFEYMQAASPAYRDMPLTDFDDGHLQAVSIYDLKEYKRYLKDGFLVSGKPIKSNSPRSVAKKFAAVRGMFRFLYISDRIPKNPAEFVSTPKAKQKKTTIFLEDREIADLLTLIEIGDAGMNAHQQAFCNKTRLRDLAIIYVLLGTGIRAAECQGLDRGDIDFQEQCFPVIRKGGEMDMIYFSDEVAGALRNYMDGPRAATTALPGHEEALFLSLQKKRISIDAIEKTVEKYTKQICTNKHITPHKLRSTFGTHFYQAGGNDLIATQNAMGHADPGTTAIYIGEREENKKKAKNIHYRF